MKLREIFRFEFRHQLTQISTWLLFAALFLFGFMLLRMVTLPDGTWLNAPGTIASFTVFASAIWLMLGGGVAGDAATRDLQTRVHPLTYTLPVSKSTYLGGRFLAALSINAFILLGLFGGVLLSFYGPGARTEFIGPFRLASYLTAYFVIALPLVITATAVQFTFATVSGRSIGGYVASLLLLMTHPLATILKFRYLWKIAGILADLIGIGIAAEMEAWTPLDKNTRLVMMEGAWLWNRLMWISIAAGLLYYTYLHFDFKHVVPGTWWSKLRKKRGDQRGHSSSERLENSKVEPSSPWSGEIQLLPVQSSFSLKTHLRQVIGIASKSFGAIARSRIGLGVVGVLAIGTGLFATEYMEWLGVPLFARTGEVLRVLTPSLSDFRTQWIIIPLLTIFYAGELLWREREAGMNELSDTAPIREPVLFVGKFIGLALALTIWVTFLMLGGIINQVVMGYDNFEISVYIRALFGIQLTTYLLFAALVFTIHVLVNQKYIGHMVALCAYGFVIAAPFIGVGHHMLIYGSDPGWSYSDMRGFSPFIKPLVWFKIYWASWAFLLSVVAILFWVRTKDHGIRARVRLAASRLRRSPIAFSIAAVVLVMSGGFVFYNTNILNDYSSKADRLEVSAAYEQRYGQYLHATRPILAATRLRAEIYPEEQKAEMHVTYHLVNRNKVSIDSIHLTTLPHLSLTDIAFDREWSPIVIDDNAGYRMFSLKRPLLPDDSLRLDFKITIQSDGFTNNGVDADIVSNGSRITSDWLPVIGYDDDRRLHDERDRRKYGLPPRQARTSLYDTSARYDTRHAEQMHFEAIVGTAKDQIAVAPGALRRTWTNGERTYFHYATDVPIYNSYALFSARYAVQKTLWTPSAQVSHGNSFPTARPVAIEIYYHPSHDANVGRMLKSIQASLEYYSRVFGPYPFSHFRVVERPGAGRGMHAEPMTIDYQEGYSLMNPKPGGLDLPYHIMSHEVAHQWWGFQLAPAEVEGAGLLVESLATYSAMQVVEETLGYDHLRKYLSQMRLEYEIPRSAAAPPLLQANNSFMNYRKGPFALFALRNYIGKDTVNHALRKLLHTTSPPLPTTLDLYRELQQVTPDSLHYLVHDLFAANTFWQLKTTQAGARKLPGENWEVTLELDARKFTVDSIGVEKEIPMNDWIEIGIYGARVEGQSSPTVLHQQKHRINTGKTKITIVVEKQPSRAGIDPDHLMIDLDMDDNTRKVAIE